MTHRNKKLNTHNLQISLPILEKPDVASLDFWEELREQPNTITHILQKKELLHTPQISLPYKRA